MPKHPFFRRLLGFAIASTLAVCCAAPNAISQLPPPGSPSPLSRPASSAASPPPLTTTAQVQVPLIRSEATATLAPTARATPAVPGPPQRYSYRIVNSYPHDPQAFTQGLVYDNGALYEGTGLYGQSSLRRVTLATGVIEQQVNLPNEYFGEGIALVGEQLYQITWQSQIAFRYNKTSFQQLGSFTYPTEGWGLTYDGTRLIMSDGTATIYFRDPASFAEVGRVTVRDQYGPVTKLNELEYIDGRIYANIWQTEQIIQIDPQTGQVVGQIDLTGLTPANAGDVLNGIAYDAAGKRLFVTGKLWPTLFEIELIPQP